jgi:hypothetical protein
MDRRRGSPIPESARTVNGPHYAAYVLILVLAMRKGEILGLTWDLISFDTADLYAGPFAGNTLKLTRCGTESMLERRLTLGAAA